MAEYIAQKKREFADAKFQDFRGHTGPIQSLAWNCEGRRVATSSVDKSARVWNVERNV